jgi:PucR C-terminal helix-turn-helix domain
VTVESLQCRLDRQRDAVRAAVLSAAVTEAEPDHDQVTAALADALLTRFAAGLTGPPQPDVDLGAWRGLGARYAEVGVSHGQALHELQRAIIEVSRRWWSVAVPAEVPDLLRVGQVIDDDVDPIRAAISDGYCAALAASGSRFAGRRQLAESLITGEAPHPGLLRSAEVEPAAQYLVLCVAAGRAHTSIDEVSDRFGVPGVMGLRSEGRLDVLVPISRRSLAEPADVAARGFNRLASLLAVDVAGAAVAGIADLPAAVRKARTTLAIAARCERRGPVLADQILVERALGGDRPALLELAAVVVALAPWPHLPQTLQALYEHDLDRGRTADHLHIARRTLTKRLDRVHRLTGIHPTSARGVQTFLSAMAADHLVHDRSADDPEAVAGLDAG